MTPRQRRVMRKAIKMAKAGQRDHAYTRYARAASAVNFDENRTPAFRVALVRARRALDLMIAVENVTLVPREVMMLRALRRAGRRLNKRYT